MCAASQRSQDGVEREGHRVVGSPTGSRIVTDEPVGTVVPVGGTACPGRAVGIALHPGTSSPAACSVVVACDTVSPITLGTWIVGGPVDTVTVTVEP